MADVKIQDVNLIATPAGSNKVPVSDGSGLAKTISVDQIIGVHEATYDHSTYLTETSADVLYAPALGTDDNYVTNAEKTKLSNLSGTNTGDQDLSGYSLTSHNHNLNDLTEKSYNSLTDKPTIPSVSGLLDETAHDALDHTGLTGVPTQYTDEMAQDAIGTLITNGTQTGITVAYDDVNNKIDFTVNAADSGDVTGPASAVSNNIALFDGITGKIIKDSGVATSNFATALGVDDNYVTDAEKTKLSNLSGVNTGDQDLSGYSLISHLHAGIYEPADATILKDADIGVNVAAQVHNHDATYSQLSHNHALNDLTEKSYNSLTDKPSIPSVAGLLDETAHDLLDHTGLTGIPTAYTLPTASTTVLGGVKIDGTTILISDGVISSTGGSGGGVTDHGALTGLADDDHTQYLNETRHDLLDHTGLTGIPSITGLLDETAHDLLDHTGLTGIPTQYTDEMAQDAIGTLITNGTQSGITVSYDDANNKLDFTVTASGGGDVTGPSSVTDGNIVLFDGVTGKAIKDSAYNPSSFAAALGADDNYVTDAEKAALHSHSNKTALDSVSGVNTGDQDLSGYSLTSHLHTGIYEPADATILKDADIGVTVQAYDADLTSWAAIAPSAKQDTLVSGTNIKTINGSSILGYGNLEISGSGTSIPVQETAPKSPSEGDLWVDSDASVTQAAIPVNWTSPTVIADTANLTYRSYNIVSVTSADKTLTLPEITASDYGKFIVVEIAASTTKLITIDGYSTQTIDGAATRVMWAREVAQLVATASGWTKVGGKSIPMYSFAEGTENKTLAAYTYWTTVLTSESSNNIAMLSGGGLVVKRTGIYNIRTWTINSSGSADNIFSVSRVGSSDVGLMDIETQTGSPYNARGSIAFSVVAGAGDSVVVRVQSTLVNPQAILSKLWLHEVVQW